MASSSTDWQKRLSPVICGFLTADSTRSLMPSESEFLEIQAAKSLGAASHCYLDLIVPDGQCTAVTSRLGQKGFRKTIVTKSFRVQRPALHPGPPEARHIVTRRMKDITSGSGFVSVDFLPDDEFKNVTKASGSDQNN